MCDEFPSSDEKKFDWRLEMEAVSREHDNHTRSSTKEETEEGQES